MSAKADRLRSHLQKCSKSVKEKKSPSTTPDVVCVEDIDCVVSSKDINNDCVPKSKTLTQQRQTSMTGYVIPTSDGTRVALDEQITKMFYACNLPFNVADNPVFRETIELLGPVSNRFLVRISGHLLDSVHKKLNDRVKETD